ncbi:MAG TPA: hypothetical protein DEB24_08495 [Coriobacteriia bacterium]|nr:hypothetical protein [Coriobacteriia bacterium]
MNKKLCIVVNGILLLWFFLDMTGFSFGDQMLVSQAWKDDGLFFLIYAAAFTWFITKESVGKYVLLIWLFSWLAAQFYFHWFFTIAGPWEGNIQYFSDTIKLFESSTVYIVDLYHIVLHLLILLALICTLAYCLKRSKNTSE